MVTWLCRIIDVVILVSLTVSLSSLTVTMVKALRQQPRAVVVVLISGRTKVNCTSVDYRSQFFALYV